jgi:ankyrin repeat protein
MSSEATCLGSMESHVLQNKNTEYNLEGSTPPAQQRAGTPGPQPPREPSSTQHFDNITGADNARIHVGNFYNIAQHHHITKAQEVIQGVGPDDEDNRKAKFLASYQNALAFPQMSLRASTITTAYAQTCQWFFEAPEYKRWRDTSVLSEHHGILWIKGKPGAGKSTLMKCALEHARGSCKAETSTSFFFNARGTILEASTEGLYRALLHQMQCPPVKLMMEPKLQEFDKGHSWSLEQLKDLLREAVYTACSESPLTFYIDALDEGDAEDHVRDMMGFFEELTEEAVSKNLPFSICLASRHYPRISVQHCEELILDDHQGHNSDIATYVRSKLRLKQSAFKDELASQIQQRAAGIFLWVVLVVGILNREHDEGNQHNLTARLKQTPNGLRDLFDELLKKGGTHTRLLPAIQWALFALTPLNPAQLYYAILSAIDEVDATTVSWDREVVGIETITAFIVSSSRGLLEVTSKPSVTGRRVQFIHEAARQYMLDRGLRDLDPNIADNVEAYSHERLAQWCREYLRHVIESGLTGFEPNMPTSWHAFKKQAEFPWPFLEYALEGALVHAETAARLGVCEGLDHNVPLDEWLYLESLELRPPDEISANSGREAIALSSRQGARIADSAQLSTMLQMLTAANCRWLVYHALRRIARLEEPHKQSYLDAHMIVENFPTGVTALHIAIEAGYVWIARALIKSGANPNVQSDNGTPLHIIFYSIDIIDPVLKAELINLLIDGGADVNAYCDVFDTVLQVAVRSNADASLVGLLLERGADPNICDASGLPALRIAVRKEASTVVEQLLKHGADPDMDHAAASTCLGIAFQRRNMDIAELLLQYGAKVNAQDGGLGSPLHATIANVWIPYPDRARVIQLLLKYGCDFHVSIDGLGTVVEFASKRNDWLSMRCLQDHGVPVDAEDFSGSGPYSDPEEAERIRDRLMCRA